jgi:hypothetical protein
LQVALNPEPSNGSNQYRIIFIRYYDPVDAKFFQLLSSKFNVIHIQCSRLNTHYLNQQTVQSTINNHLSLMKSILHVSASTKPSSGKV